jgi:nitrate reductase delta subunit
MRTLKILGFLLTYPEQDHVQAISQCMDILKSEKWLSDTMLEKLDAVTEAFSKTDLLDLQESYVDLFDRTPSLSLHLFEHIHGDSRDRGQALVDLLKVYEEAGLFISQDEMPDYLPLFTEYLSSLPPQEASETLGSVVNILSSLAERLKNRGSYYADILNAIIETAARAPDAKAVEEFLRKSSGEALSNGEMDKQWEEQFAFANTPQTTGIESGCPKAEDMLARMPGYKKEERV